jgi:hypothetical protein
MREERDIERLAQGHDGGAAARINPRRSRHLRLMAVRRKRDADDSLVTWPFVRDKCDAGEIVGRRQSVGASGWVIEPHPLGIIISRGMQKTRASLWAGPTTATCMGSCGCGSSLHRTSAGVNRIKLQAGENQRSRPARNANPNHSSCHYGWHGWLSSTWARTS